MSHKHKLVPKYRGIEHIGTALPVETQPWLRGSKRSVHIRRQGRDQTLDQLQALVEKFEWHWPRRTVYFFSDLHADPEALTASLVASGGVRLSGRKHKHLKLTKEGKQAQFLIGGDCFDKGPSNLELLRILNKLHKRSAHMRILAGNHDVRVMLGMRSVNREALPGCEHFFIRMGAKAVPFLKEINDSYLSHPHSLKHIPGRKACEQRLYPPEQWFDEFPVEAADFEARCEHAGLSIRRAYAAALQWQRLFLHEDGEFGWFFKHMRLAMRRGSFLFVHAGLDNNIAHLINQKGIRQLNREFKKQLQGNPMRFYYGPVANAIRTKYRPGDRHLTSAGARQVHDNELHVIVHGHKSMRYGQRISVRKSLINFECDVTLDRHSRARDGLAGPGAGVTIIRPDKKIIGISTDHPYVKVFDPGDLI